MQSGLRVGALTIALVGVLGAAAHNNIGTKQTTQQITSLLEMPVIEDDEITGSIDRSLGAKDLTLDEEQRGFIFLGVINLPDVPDVELPTRRPTSALPDAVELYELPAMVTRKIPMVKEMRFVKLDDRILLVRPADRIVVSEIPRYRIR